MKSYTITDASVMCNYNKRQDFINDLIRLNIFYRIPEDYFHKGSITLHSDFRKKYKNEIKDWFNEGEVQDRYRIYRYQLRITLDGIKFLKALLHKNEIYEQLEFELIC